MWQVYVHMSREIFRSTLTSYVEIDLVPIHLEQNIISIKNMSHGIT